MIDDGDEALIANQERNRGRITYARVVMVSTAGLVDYILEAQASRSFIKG